MLITQVGGVGQCSAKVTLLSGRQQTARRCYGWWRRQCIAEFRWSLRVAPGFSAHIVRYHGGGQPDCASAVKGNPGSPAVQAMDFGSSQIANKNMHARLGFITAALVLRIQSTGAIVMYLPVAMLGAGQDQESRLPITGSAETHCASAQKHTYLRGDEMVWRS